MALGQSVFNRNSSNSGKKTINVYSNYRMTNSKDVGQYGGSSMSFSFSSRVFALIAGLLFSFIKRIFKNSSS